MCHELKLNKLSHSCNESAYSTFCFIQVISGHLGWVRCIAVEPGNQWFVTGSADRTIKVIGKRKKKNLWFCICYTNVIFYFLRWEMLLELLWFLRPEYGVKFITLISSVFQIKMFGKWYLNNRFFQAVHTDYLTLIPWYLLWLQNSSMLIYKKCLKYRKV